MSIAGSFFLLRGVGKISPLAKKIFLIVLADSGPVVRFSEVRSEIRAGVMFRELLFILFILFILFTPFLS
jgi:hypothetical protein